MLYEYVNQVKIFYLFSVNHSYQLLLDRAANFWTVSITHLSFCTDATLDRCYRYKQIGYAKVSNIWK